MMYNLINNKSLFSVDDEQNHGVEEDLYDEIYGAPIFDVYDNGEPSRVVLHTAIEEEFVALRHLRNELDEEMMKMVQYWEDRALIWSKKMKKMKTMKKPNTPAKVQMATDLQVSTEPQRLVTSSPTGPAISAPKCQRSRTVPRRRNHHTSRTRKLKRCNQSNSSNLRCRVNYIQPREHDELPRSSSPRWTFQISFYVLFSRVKDRTGANQKHPFDRGKSVTFMRDRGLVSNLEDKVLWRVEY